MSPTRPRPPQQCAYTTSPDAMRCCRSATMSCSLSSVCMRVCVCVSGQASGRRHEPWGEGRHSDSSLAAAAHMRSATTRAGAAALTAACWGRTGP
jgi:hypothetical protein